MKHSMVTAGIFVVAALVLFSVGLFLIGTSHNAFTRHVIFYTKLAEVNGITPGLKVRVGGFDAGQVDSIGVPDKPSGEFRIKLQIDNKLRNLVREDSVLVHPQRERQFAGGPDRRNSFKQGADRTFRHDGQSFRDYGPGQRGDQ
jgi:hypothetical protein